MYTLLEHDIDYRQIVQNVIEGKVANRATAILIFGYLEAGHT